MILKSILFLMLIGIFCPACTEKETKENKSMISATKSEEKSTIFNGFSSKEESKAEKNKSKASKDKRETDKDEFAATHQIINVPDKIEKNIEQSLKQPLVLPKVTLCLCWRIQCQFAGFYAAMENGFYKEEGLDVVLKAGGPDVRPFQEIFEKNAQIGIGQAQEVLIARDKGIPIQCIANNFQTGALRLISKKSLGITDPADLRGKTISLWFGGYEYQCLGLLEKYGMSQKDVNLVKQGWDVDDFVDGKVDVASVMVYNELNIVYEKGITNIDILNYADYGINFPEDAFFALEEYIQQNPDIISRILRASYRGWQWAMENPKEAVAIVIKYADKPNKEHEKNMLKEIFPLMINKHTKEHGLGYIYFPDWLGMAKILFQQKLIKKVPDLKKVLQPQFIEKIKILPPNQIPAF